MKTCNVTLGPASPNENAQGMPWTTTTVETKTAAYNSNSDSGEVITTVTTNGGGHVK
jgi:hypothetical protein